MHLHKENYTAGKLLRLRRFKVVKGKQKRQVNMKMCIVRILFLCFVCFWVTVLWRKLLFVGGKKVEDNEQRKKTQTSFKLKGGKNCCLGTTSAKPDSTTPPPPPSTLNTHTHAHSCVHHRRQDQTLQEKLGLFLAVPKQQVCCFLASAVSPMAPLEINSQKEKLSWPQNFSNFFFPQVCFMFEGGRKKKKAAINSVAPQGVM